MWADSGATWYYGFTGIISQGFVSIELVGDSTILGIEAQKLEVYKSGIDFMSGQYFESILGYEYTYSDSDRVYHKVGDEFKILYDFSAEIGDTLFHYLINEFMNPYCDSIGRSIVSDKGIEMINDEELRWYEVEYLDGEVTFFGRIYEKLGAIDFMFPNNDLCILDEDYYGPFRCYSDSSFGEFVSPEYTGDCEFVYNFPIPNYFANDPEWCVTISSLYDNCGINTTQVHYINGEEVIEGLEYKKLYSKGVSEEYWIMPDVNPCEDTWEFDVLNGYIRQEGEKIYFLEPNYEEQLYYDFSLSIGDTIPISPIFPYDSEPSVVSAIDSVYLYDNYYKRLYFERNLPMLDDTIYYFIEGIGHKYGFLAPLDDYFEIITYLHAYRKGEIPYYQFDVWGDCDFAVSLDELTDNQMSISISPNPAKDKLHLEIAPTIKLKEIAIYTLSGQKVLILIPSTSSGRHTVDLSLLQSGMYLLEVESIEGFREVKRFVVE